VWRRPATMAAAAATGAAAASSVRATAVALVLLKHAQQLPRLLLLQLPDLQPQDRGTTGQARRCAFGLICVEHACTWQLAQSEPRTRLHYDHTLTLQEKVTAILMSWRL
jgi:hypothetical protein